MNYFERRAVPLVSAGLAGFFVTKAESGLLSAGVPLFPQQFPKVEGLEQQTDFSTTGLIAAAAVGILLYYFFAVKKVA